jgi:hypothetical protein
MKISADAFDGGTMDKPIDKENERYRKERA